jgi:hypothetical protein
VSFCVVFGSSYEPSRAQLRQCLVGSMTSALPYKNKTPSGPYKIFRKAIGSLDVASSSGAAVGGESRREEPPAPARGAPHAPPPGRRAAMLRRPRWPASSARRNAVADVLCLTRRGGPHVECGGGLCGGGACPTLRRRLRLGWRREAAISGRCDRRRGVVAVGDCEDGLEREEREEKMRNERKGRGRAGV